MTEEELIERARWSLSECNWTLGECASLWTKKFAKGRTDAAFGELLQLSADQVYQRRRVWETFSDVRREYLKLSWSHFCVALGWDDASECLQWAEDMSATVAEMRAWRRAQRGEDLSAAEEPEAAYALASSDPPPSTLNSQPVHADDLEERGSRETQYAPFSNTARGPARSSEDARPEADASELIYKRIACSLEKCGEALSAQLIEEFPSLPYKLQERVTAAIDRLSAIATMFEPVR
jgi:hypothetical protein